MTKVIGVRFRKAGKVYYFSPGDEEIKAGLYSREEIREMLKTEEFSSRSQTVAYFFANGFSLPGLYKKEM